MERTTWTILSQYRSSRRWCSKSIMVPVTTKPASSALTIPAHTSKDYSYFEPSKPIQIVTTDLERKKKRFTSINPNLLLLPFHNGPMGRRECTIFPSTSPCAEIQPNERETRGRLLRIIVSSMRSQGEPYLTPKDSPDIERKNCRYRSAPDREVFRWRQWEVLNTPLVL